MAICITIAGTTYSFPEQGDDAGWGGCATDTVKALADQLSTLVGANDISRTTVCITNCQCTVANVGTGSSLLKFSNSAVRSFLIEYDVRRVGCCTIVERGDMFGVYAGCCTWTFGYDHVGCAGMSFTITNAGQVQYTSTSLTGQTSGKMNFSAKTYAQ